MVSVRQNDPLISQRGALKLIAFSLRSRVLIDKVADRLHLLRGQIKFQCLDVGSYMFGVSGSDHDGSDALLV